jgi:hypothetical protein
MFFVGWLVGAILSRGDEAGGCLTGIFFVVVGMIITAVFAPQETRTLTPIDVRLYNMNEGVRADGALIQSATDNDYLIFESIDPKTGALEPQKMKKYNNSVKIYLDNPEQPFMRTYRVSYTSTSPVYGLFGYPKFDSDNTTEFHVPVNTVDKIYLIH